MCNPKYSLAQVPSLCAERLGQRLRAQHQLQRWNHLWQAKAWQGERSAHTQTLDVLHVQGTAPPSCECCMQHARPRRGSLRHSTGLTTVSAEPAAAASISVSRRRSLVYCLCSCTSRGRSATGTRRANCRWEGTQGDRFRQLHQRPSA